ncbi:hypothetical protein BLOT_003557 [Blomia tropicalis]|nr:hypothetical protein BLOT_003557 [Blomia tropicalis]
MNSSVLHEQRFSNFWNVVAIGYVNLVANFSMVLFLVTFVFDSYGYFLSQIIPVSFFKWPVSD